MTSLLVVARQGAANDYLDSITNTSFLCVRFNFLATSICRKPASSRASRSLPTKSAYSLVRIVSTTILLAYMLDCNT